LIAMAAADPSLAAVITCARGLAAFAATQTPGTLVWPLADEKGLAAVSMRKLADQLGAGAMSLYHYFPNKDALLDEMVDAIFARIEAPSTDEDWKTALRKRAISTRAALTRHPWALDVMESRTSPGMANLQLHNAVVASRDQSEFRLPVSGGPVPRRHGTPPYSFTYAPMSSA
jgi:hypothetical protein